MNYILCSFKISRFYRYLFHLFISCLAVSLELVLRELNNIKISSLSFSKIYTKVKWILDCLLVCNFYDTRYLFTWSENWVGIWSVKKTGLSDYFCTLFHLTYIHIITCIWEKNLQNLFTWLTMKEVHIEKSPFPPMSLSLFRISVNHSLFNQSGVGEHLSYIFTVANVLQWITFILFNVCAYKEKIPRSGKLNPRC